MYICGNNFQFAGTTTTSSDPVLGKHKISEEEKWRNEERREKVFMDVQWGIYTGYKAEPVT